MSHLLLAALFIASSVAAVDIVIPDGLNPRLAQISQPPKEFIIMGYWFRCVETSPFTNLYICMWMPINSADK